MSIGDIVDRYSICKLKHERLKLDNSLEIELLKNEIDKYSDIELYVEILYEVNGKIWDLESDIRKGNEQLLGLEEIGRRALKIREHNNLRVTYKNDINSKYEEGFIEVKMDHGSEKEPSVIITLTTVPERLLNDKEDGLKLVLKSLCEQKDNDYEVHFNIPNFYHVTNEPYEIPSWLNKTKLKYKNLKIFRTEDFGPPTKFVPTIQRTKNEETIIITVDDDLVYHEEMVCEHRKYQSELKDSVICYDGRGSQIPKYKDIRDSWVLCVTHVRETHGLQHYKSASYKVKLFTQEFYDFYFGKTFSDDILVSKYFRDNNIKMYVVPYEKETPLYETRESWDIHQGVTTFPVLRYASSVPDTGCNNPNMLKLQPKFYVAPDLGNKKNKKLTYTTDKFNHGYVPIYEEEFKKMKHVNHVLEIGVYEGSSLRYFKDTFKNAIIYGADINECKKYEEERIKIFQLNQEKRDELESFINNIDFEFDIIIDDGGHTMKQQQLTLGVLFKKLKSGGLYIVEDLHTSNRSPWMNDQDEISTLDMLKNISEKNEIISNHMTDEEKSYLKNNIESVRIWSATDDYMQSVTSLIYKK